MSNMHFSKVVVISSNDQPWSERPMVGVQRKPLAREDAERGHATSIVRYKLGAKFSAHDYPLGEEICVIDGVFIDEHGRYPVGTWIRNPRLSRHDPYVEQETIILVKDRHLEN